MPNLNVPNRTLFHGDNLPFLHGINSESVHLIATDPPFNKNKDFHATPDSLAAGAGFQDRWSWRDDIHDDWLDAIQHDYPEVWQIVQSAKHSYGYDMAAFLCFMAVRLLEMHRISAGGRQPFSALRHHRQPLPEAAVGQHLWHRQLPQRGHLAQHLGP